MDIANLDFTPASLEAAVVIFVLSVLAEDRQVPALRELRRVMRPGGTIRLLEYVRPRQPAVLP